MNPYESLPPKSFWKLAVANRNMFDIENLWDPKFNIKPDHKVVTYGSCFAQHIGNALTARGFNWLSTEQAPPFLSEQDADLYSYNIFSARTGNIYTASLLKQWTEWALGTSDPSKEVWQQDEKFYDPFRPKIEPNGFESKLEMMSSREETVQAFKESICQADYFVFTLGLTESWSNVNGDEYPMCPGTISGEFDDEVHKFKNQQFVEIQNSLSASITLMRELNPNLKFILTVSPVPLTATNSNNHVLLATMESKSILRAVAGQLVSEHSYIDYFPSYEIINSPVFRGTFFQPNSRSVNMYGVNFVMDSFFKCLESKYGVSSNKNSETSSSITSSNSGDEPVDEHCEEAVLAAFGAKQ